MSRQYAGTTGMAQVLSALLHGACTVYTNDQQTSKTQSTGSGFLNLRLTFTLLRSHSHFGVDCSPSALSSPSRTSRRLRLVLTQQSHLTKGEKSLLDDQRPVHGKIHLSGLLFGYAADGCTEPDWFVLPDGRAPNAWKLIHAARRGGDRFSVGSGVRYALDKLATLPIKPRNIALNPSTKSTSMMRGGG